MNWLSGMLYSGVRRSDMPTASPFDVKGGKFKLYTKIQAERGAHGNK